MVVTPYHVLGETTRRFDGNIFRSARSFTTEKEAEKDAEELRARGTHNVRVSKVGDLHVVFVRVK